MQDYHDPWRRGIYRTKAQRLSLSLAPLVAQRSLLFRIKADLAGAGKDVGSYGELEGDVEESPLLYSVTPSASAQIESSNTLSSVEPPHIDEPSSFASALSTTSVYSQESWKQPATPAMPLDRRRNAMAFSPSVQWDEFSSPALVSGCLDFTDGVYHRRTRERPNPSNAQVKTNISTSASDGNDQLADHRSVGPAHLADDSQSLLQTQNSEEDAVSSDISSEEREKDAVVSLVIEQSTGTHDRPTSSAPTSTPRKLLKSTKFSKMISRLSRHSSSSTQGKAEDTTLPQLYKNRTVRRISQLRPLEIPLSPIKLALDIPELCPPEEENTAQNQEKKPKPECRPSLPLELVSSSSLSLSRTTTLSSSHAASTSLPPLMQSSSISTHRETYPSTSARMPSTPGPLGPKRTISAPALPKISTSDFRWNPADMPPLPPMPLSFLLVPKRVVTQPTGPTQAIVNVTLMPQEEFDVTKEPRPRPPRAMRPLKHNRISLLEEGNAEESDQSLYSPLRTKAERWEEIIAKTPVSGSARPRGKSVSCMRTVSGGSESAGALCPVFEYRLN